MRTSSAHNANLNIRHSSQSPVGGGSRLRRKRRLLTRRRRTNERAPQRRSRRRAKPSNRTSRNMSCARWASRFASTRRPVMLAPALVAVEGILEILIPTIMASLIDEGITGGSMPSTVKFGVILLVCCDGLAGCRLPVRQVRGHGRRGLRQEPAPGPVQEGSGLQLHQYRPVLHRLDRDPTDHRRDEPAERLHDDHPSGRACPDHGDRGLAVLVPHLPVHLAWCSWPASRSWRSACAVWPCSCTPCSSACSTPTTRSTTWSTRTCRASAW